MRLFDLIGKKRNNSLPVPYHVSNNGLPNTFNMFFTNKIEKIRNSLDQIPTQIFLKIYSCQKYVRTIISKCRKKKAVSELDPLPAKLFNECVDVLLPYTTRLFNDSLASGTFSSRFKDSLVIPVLKKNNPLLIVII